VTLFALLACTGLRISEALRLKQRDVDLECGVVTVVAGKFRRARLVPLHETAAAALATYATRRDQYLHRQVDDTFFLSERGTSLKYIRVLTTFTTLRRQLGWESGGAKRPPRIHDLRHSFAVCTLLRWYEEGIDIDHGIARLSTYLGHVKVSDTYWYLSAVPALLAAGGARFERYAARQDNTGAR
jgi:integrase